MTIRRAYALWRLHLRAQVRSLVTAESAHKALDFATSNDFALILLDVRMPVLDGFQIAARIRELPRSRDTPIIFITGFERNEKRGYEAGGVDYLLKPVAPDVLRAKANAFVQLARKAAVVNSSKLCLSNEQQELERQAREYTAWPFDRGQARGEAATAHWRAAFLAEASRILGSSLYCEDMVVSLAQWVVQQIADW